MAYLYRKLRSPFWYIQYIDADKIKHDKSTGFRADDPNDTIKAKVLRAELEAREYQRVPMVNGATWDYWVPKFFERHCPTKATLDRYEDAWKWVALWLQNNRIYSPRQLTYRLGIEYLDWRTTFKKRTGKIVGRNTAILEFKLLSLVMGEAVRLGHADANPLVSMKIRRDRQPKKPELTDDEILEIQEALKEEPEWMQVSFEIGLHTGCRLFVVQPKCSTNRCQFHGVFYMTSQPRRALPQRNVWALPHWRYYSSLTFSTMSVYPNGCVCHAVLAPVSKETLAPLTRTGAGA